MWYSSNTVVYTYFRDEFHRVHAKYLWGHPFIERQCSSWAVCLHPQNGGHVRHNKECSSQVLNIYCMILETKLAEKIKFRGWYDAAFRLGQETHQILFEFQQTRWASRSKSRSRSQDVSSLALYRKFTSYIQ